MARRSTSLDSILYVVQSRVWLFYTDSLALAIVLGHELSFGAANVSCIPSLVLTMAFLRRM